MAAFYNGAILDSDLKNLVLKEREKFKEFQPLGSRLTFVYNNTQNAKLVQKYCDESTDAYIAWREAVEDLVPPEFKDLANHFNAEIQVLDANQNYPKEDWDGEHYLIFSTSDGLGVCFLLTNQLSFDFIDPYYVPRKKRFMSFGDITAL